ncbi:hypothetical protein L207DRAFT_636134 [Hyaloscypha variabilis F]|uniref:Ubiquitin-like protease family profile domain-containing protein n=1 Tax=Hyaloscypha variabilis (strain UAMH 11265 / GT02V1 / F) TaxID=1149755 RepID=A0A2J6RFZ8_HYAVF|nr:hypothetical protein L207DRAFT_636134 [Hyaloscypha variabilis F]
MRKALGMLGKQRRLGTQETGAHSFNSQNCGAEEEERTKISGQRKLPLWEATMLDIIPTKTTAHLLLPKRRFHASISLGPISSSPSSSSLLINHPVTFVTQQHDEVQRFKCTIAHPVDYGSRVYLFDFGDWYRPACARSSGDAWFQERYSPSPLGALPSHALAPPGLQNTMQHHDPHYRHSPSPLGVLPSPALAAPGVKIKAPWHDHNNVISPASALVYSQNHYFAHPTSRTTAPQHETCHEYSPLPTGRPCTNPYLVSPGLWNMAPSNDPYRGYSRAPPGGQSTSPYLAPSGSHNMIPHQFHYRKDPASSELPGMPHASENCIDDGIRSPHNSSEQNLQPDRRTSYPPHCSNPAKAESSYSQSTVPKSVQDDGKVGSETRQALPEHYRISKSGQASCPKSYPPVIAAQSGSNLSQVSTMHRASQHPLPPKPQFSLSVENDGSMTTDEQNVTTKESIPKPAVPNYPPSTTEKQNVATKESMPKPSVPNCNTSNTNASQPEQRPPESKGVPLNDPPGNFMTEQSQASSVGTLDHEREHIVSISKGNDGQCQAKEKGGESSTFASTTIAPLKLKSRSPQHPVVTKPPPSSQSSSTCGATPIRHSHRRLRRNVSLRDLYDIPVSPALSGSIQSQIDSVPSGIENNNTTTSCGQQTMSFVPDTPFVAITVDQIQQQSLKSDEQEPVKPGTSQIHPEGKLGSSRPIAALRNTSSNIIPMSRENTSLSYRPLPKTKGGFVSAKRIDTPIPFSISSPKKKDGFVVPKRIDTPNPSSISSPRKKDGIVVPKRIDTPTPFALSCTKKKDDFVIGKRIDTPNPFALSSTQKKDGFVVIPRSESGNILYDASPERQKNLVVPRKNEAVNPLYESSGVEKITQAAPNNVIRNVASTVPTNENNSVAGQPQPHKQRAFREDPPLLVEDVDKCVEKLLVREDAKVADRMLSSHSMATVLRTFKIPSYLYIVDPFVLTHNGVHNVRHHRCWSEKRFTKFVMCVLVDNHWTASIVDIEMKKIFTFNSIKTMPEGHSICKDVVKSKPETFGIEEYDFVLIETQQQSDASSCGLFSLQNVLAFIHGLRGGEFLSIHGFSPQYLRSYFAGMVLDTWPSINTELLGSLYQSYMAENMQVIMTTRSRIIAITKSMGHTFNAAVDFRSKVEVALYKQNIDSYFKQEAVLPPKKPQVKPNEPVDLTELDDSPPPTRATNIRAKGWITETRLPVTAESTSLTERSQFIPIKSRSSPFTPSVDGGFMRDRRQVNTDMPEKSLNVPSSTRDRVKTTRNRHHAPENPGLNKRRDIPKPTVLKSRDADDIIDNSPDELNSSPIMTLSQVIERPKKRRLPIIGTGLQPVYTWADILKNDEANKIVHDQTIEYLDAIGGIDIEICIFRSSPGSTALDRARLERLATATFNSLDKILRLRGNIKREWHYFAHRAATTDLPSMGNLYRTKKTEKDEFVRSLMTHKMASRILFVCKGIEGGPISARGFKNFYTAYAQHKFLIVVEEQINRQVCNRKIWTQGDKCIFLIFPLEDLVRGLEGQPCGAAAMEFIENQKLAYDSRHALAVLIPNGRNGDRTEQVLALMFKMMPCRVCGIKFEDTVVGRNAYVEHCLEMHSSELACPEAVRRKCPLPGCPAVSFTVDDNSYFRHIDSHMERVLPDGVTVNDACYTSSARQKRENSRGNFKYRCPFSSSCKGVRSKWAKPEYLYLHMLTFHAAQMDEVLCKIREMDDIPQHRPPESASLLPTYFPSATQLPAEDGSLDVDGCDSMDEDTDSRLSADAFISALFGTNDPDDQDEDTSSDSSGDYGDEDSH